jgi:tetratricopeptide (TPR) repeat protein
MSAVRALLFALILAGLVGLGACAGRPAGRSEKSTPPEAAVAPPDSGEEVALAIPREEAEPSSAELPEPHASEESVEVYDGPPADQPAIGGERSIRGQAGALPVPSAPTARKPAEVRKKATSPAESAPKAPPKAGSPQIAGSPPKAGSAPQIAGSAAAAAETRPPSPGREVLARKGDTVVIDLEGRGWLLLPGNSAGVSFTGSEAGAERTTFSFKALEYGEYDLAFQLQDNSRGVARGEVVRLRVLPEEQFRGLLAAGQAAPESGDPERLHKAERLFAAGFYDLALPEYLGIYREADPLLNDRLASIYLQRGEAAAAAKFYDRNLSALPPYTDQAILGLVRAGLELGSPELVLEHLPALLELRTADIERELLAVARFVAGQGRYPLAFDLLSEYLRRYPRGAGMDRALFQLAQLYELESPLRDVRQAREYYRKVYEGYPESEYAAEARNRILYLDRYFFHVQ